MEFSEFILIQKLHGVVLKYPRQENVTGTLCIAGHHLLMTSQKEGVGDLWLLHKNIDSIEKRENKPSGGVPQGGSLYVKCKDLRIFRFDISSSKELALVAQSLENLLSNLTSTNNLYPFIFRPQYSILENGYSLYGPEEEFARVLATDEWRLSRVNASFSVCASYGPAVVVPKAVTDKCLEAAASFRDGGRFPVLAYRHNNGAVLLRSSQPMYGPKHRRCRQDEAILNAVVPNGRKGVIYDLRSSKCITEQQGRGGGTESSSNYTQWKVYNRAMDEVDNPVLLLDSFTKLIEACNETDISVDKWLSKLESGGWLESVRNAIDTACTISQHLHYNGDPVLIHDSSGQDVTLVISSLIQIILNPDCRNIRGLQALIEREWLQAGHPFATRHRCGPYAPPLAGSGAAFALFLDCVRQFLEQFPCTFEYLQSLLVLLFQHSYASQFGTFLCDNVKERTSLKVYEQTTSLWSWLNMPEELAAYINPLYEPTPTVIWPSVAPMSIVIWEELYLRDTAAQSAESRVEQVRCVRTREQHLRAQAAQLRRELRELIHQWRALTDKQDPAGDKQNPASDKQDPASDKQDPAAADQPEKE